MDPLRSIRILVIVQIGTLLAGIVAGLALEGTLPEPLRSWLEEDDAAPMTGPRIAWVVAATMLLALLAAAWIHLWNARRHARLLYTAATAAGFLLTAVGGPVVMTGVESAVGALEGIASGLMLGILYFSELGRVFGPPRRAGGPSPEDDLIG